MKTRLPFIFLTFLLISILLLPNTFAEDYTKMNLSEGAIARFGKGGINKIQYSPDNRFLAVHLWDVDTGKLIKILPGHSRRVWQVAFSPDGNTIASGSGDGTVLLWDVR